jgi:HAMP domain-containing protein
VNAGARIPRGSRLGTKILLPAIALFLVFATAVVIGFTHLHTRSGDARIVDDLESHTVLMATLLLEKEQEIALHARFLADMVNLSEEIEDSAGGRSVVIHLLDYLQSKRVETRLHRGPPTDETPYATLVRKGFLGIRTTTLVSDDTGRPTVLRLASVAPVERETGIAEVVLAAYDLDHLFLEELKGRIGPEISLMVDGEFTASTLSELGCLEALGDLASGSMSLDPEGETGPILGQVDCSGGPYRVLLSPFEVGFQQAGLYALSSPLVGPLAAPARIRTYTLITAVGILAVVVLVYTWVVRRITWPLRDLSLAARSVAAGDLSGSIEARSADEVGGLSRDFNTMVKQLRETRRQIDEHHEQAR